MNGSRYEYMSLVANIHVPQPFNTYPKLRMQCVSVEGDHSAAWAAVINHHALERFSDAWRERLDVWTKSMRGSGEF